MLYIPTNVKINLEWSVKKGVGNEAEDFSRSTVSLFLFGDKNRWAVPCTADYAGVVRAELPETLEEGAYGLELLWIKNENSIHTTRCLQRTRKTCVFMVDAGYTANTEGLPLTLKMETVAAPFGYDGLSAYEAAVLRGKTDLSEMGWLESLGASSLKWYTETESSASMGVPTKGGGEAQISVADEVAGLSVTDNGQEAGVVLHNSGEIYIGASQTIYLTAEAVSLGSIENLETFLLDLATKVNGTQQ